MAVDPIHTQRFKETAERMALEVRAKVTSQRQRDPEGSSMYCVKGESEETLLGSGLRS